MLRAFVKRVPRPLVDPGRVTRSNLARRRLTTHVDECPVLKRAGASRHLDRPQINGAKRDMYDVINTFLAYIISLGIIGAGIGWIVVGTSSTLFIGIGIASIVVGVASLLNEVRYRTH